MKLWSRARWVAGVAILALILLTTDVSGIGDALSEADLGLTALVVALNLPLLLLVSLRSRLVLASLGHDLPASTLLSTVTLGFVAGSFTPGASGELLRTDALRTNAGITAHDGLALVAFERLLSFYLLVLIGGAIGAVLLLPVALAALAIVAAVALTALPAFAGPLLRHIPEPRAEPVTFWQKALSLLRRTLGRMETLLRDKGLVAAWSVVTLATFGLVATQFWLLGKSVEGHLSYTEAVGAFAGPQLLSNLSFIPFGLGVVDGSIVGFLTSRGLTNSQALSFAVLVRATITLPLVIAAVAAYVHLTLQRRVAGKDASFP
ncbi:MAG TPA: lysylphosphatidylglycerol synthase transmembrane domain-containing protein [Dehalococcoidia bacterium]|nr:lysylphosphatidylglycerol synthase transmembrane domain-containing protein [Dehalococcoidia bacterium]